MFKLFGKRAYIIIWGLGVLIPCSSQGTNSTSMWNYNHKDFTQYILVQSDCDSGCSNDASTSGVAFDHQSCVNHCKSCLSNSNSRFEVSSGASENKDEIAIYTCVGQDGTVNEGLLQLE